MYNRNSKEENYGAYEDPYSELDFDGEIKVNGIKVSTQKISYESEEDDSGDEFDDELSVEDALDILSEKGYDTYDEELVIEGLKEVFHFTKSQINKFLDDWEEYMYNN